MLAVHIVHMVGFVERTDAQEIADQYPDMDPRFLFATMGFNLRMSDIATAIGMHQVDRIEDFVVRRRSKS